MMKQAPPKKAVRVPVCEVKQKFKAAVEGGDQSRKLGLSQLAIVSRSKLIGLRRERARIEGKHGRKSPQVALLDQKLHVSHSRLVDVRAEADKSRQSPMERQPGIFSVFGTVRDVDGHVVPKTGVKLVATVKQQPTTVAEGRTNDAGYYQLSTDAAPNSSMDLTLLAGNDAQGCVSRTVYAKENTTSYQDFKLPLVTKTGQTSNLPTRFLGNARSTELHDLQNEKPSCQIAEIVPARRLYFETVLQAKAVGYDLCAHCFGADASKR